MISSDALSEEDGRQQSQDPNPESPMNSEAATLYKKNRQQSICFEIWPCRSCTVS